MKRRFLKKYKPGKAAKKRKALDELKRRRKQ